ncbi:gamma-sarcoglycan isoform X2 [Dunckerocampus dactyliophorus]|uniref:gamma-sarcoglycan isoform X2 n=1 Tax=Dunckerocampus dactyliophorus TaxID=161453 RepID=UPI00240558D3|nr:gamma-sarcoglycan isoform X2 [Dunckerocampus dactyliophorus]
MQKNIIQVMMVGEQYISTTTEGSSGPRPVPEHIHKIGIYGWRKRCLYLFVLLLVVMLVVNLAFTVWIFRVMWFNPEGMGLLQVHSDGVKLEDGGSEFLLPLYTQEIHSREDSPLLVHSETENVSLNARDESGNVTGRTSVGPKQAEGHAANVLLSSQNDNMLFSADGKQAAIGPDKLRITGSEGALFQHSVEVPLLKSELLRDLRLESPTRSLSMDAPKGVHLKALAGNIEAASNMDVVLQSSVGLLVLDSETVRMPSLPQSQGGVPGNVQGLYEVCVCPSGKVFLSKAGVTSTCSDNQEC